MSPIDRDGYYRSKKGIERENTVRKREGFEGYDFSIHPDKKFPPYVWRNDLHIELRLGKSAILVAENVVVVDWV